MRGPGGGRIHASSVTPSAGPLPCRRLPAPPIGMFPNRPFEIPDLRRIEAPARQPALWVVVLRTSRTRRRLGCSCGIPRRSAGWFGAKRQHSATLRRIGEGMER